MSKELKELIGVLFLLVVFALLGGNYGYIIGTTKGCEDFDVRLREVKVVMDSIEVMQERMDQFRDCRVTYKSHFDGSSIQQVQLTCPDSIKVEVER